MAKRTRSELLEVLHSTPLFCELSRKQLNDVAKACFEHRYEPGAVIIKELDYGQRMVTIVSGTARVTRGGRTIAKVQQGQSVGEMALIDGHKTSAAVVAETAVDTIELYRTAFRKLLDSSPALVRNLLLAQTARLRDLDHRMSKLG